MTRPQYLPARDYQRLVAALLASRDEDQVKIALGEIGDVWPETIKAGCELSKVISLYPEIAG